MKQQENEPDISVMKIFFSIIIFFYINYSILFFLDDFKWQVLIFIMSAYLLTIGVYRYLPSYLYILKDGELQLRRKFSERYFDDCVIKINEIKSIKKKEKINFRFWNNFYNNNRTNKLYVIQTETMTVAFDPKDDLRKALVKKIKDE